MIGSSVFLTACVVSVVVVGLTRQIFRRIGWIYKPNPKRWTRKTNPHPPVIALGGGLSIYVAIMLSIVVMDLSVRLGNLETWTKILGLATVALLIGLIDDLKDCPASIKFSIQVLLGAATVFLIGTINGLPFFLSAPITVLGVVGLMNAVNFMDNMDGTASGLMVLTMLGYAILSILTHNAKMLILSLSISGACLGFWLHNKPPARIFMGDCGSLMLGYLLSATGILATYGDYPNWFVQLSASLLIVGLFVTDITFATIWRIVQYKAYRRPIVQGGKHHLSHCLANAMGMSEWKANGILYFIQTILIVLAIGSVVTSIGMAMMFLVIGILGLLTLSWQMWRWIPEVPEIDFTIEKLISWQTKAKHLVDPKLTPLPHTINRTSRVSHRLRRK